MAKYLGVKAVGWNVMSGDWWDKVGFVNFLICVHLGVKG
jgi:hypothetical protein